MTQPVVLVVDDDNDITNLMRDFLEADGCAVLIAGDGEQALSLLSQVSIDCVLLDIMMPGISGFDVMRRIRDAGDMPVIFLSARQDESDKIRGLGLGADDYIVKSATPAEVVARVKAVLRRYRVTQPDNTVRLDFGRLVIDVTAHQVFVAGEARTLTAREFELLKLLAESPNRVFTREQIYARLWGEFGDRHTVTVHIGRLREKIEADPAHPQHIITVRGIGYRFEGERNQ
jgi:DNA-binding response OmpR family regulator